MPEFSHIPVMLTEVLDALRPRPGQVFLDGTLGGAGHSCALMERILPGGFLWGCDQDGDALRVAVERLGAVPGATGRFATREMNFAGVAQWVPAGSCDGVLLDLGVSSHQLDTPGRGFSFQHDGPLDMRMSRTAPVTAADVVNGWAAEELARVFWELGDEPEARRIARAIERERAVRRFETTLQLADAVARVCPRGGRKSHPATRVFQALRLVVNDEMGVLERGLHGAFGCLRPGGRLAVLTFHSLEDRAVKTFMRQAAQDYRLPPGQPDDPLLRIPCEPAATCVTRRSIQPSDDEVARNPRARSAQLRVLERRANDVLPPLQPQPSQ